MYCVHIIFMLTDASIHIGTQMDIHYCCIYIIYIYIGTCPVYNIRTTYCIARKATGYLLSYSCSQTKGQSTRGFEW